MTSYTQSGSRGGSSVDESRRDLHRTRTMPARRARSSTDVADDATAPDCAGSGQRRRRRPCSTAADATDPGPGRGSVTSFLLLPLVGFLAKLE